MTVEKRFRELEKYVIIPPELTMQQDSFHHLGICGMMSQRFFNLNQSIEAITSLINKSTNLAETLPRKYLSYVEVTEDMTSFECLTKMLNETDECKNIKRRIGSKFPNLLANEPFPNVKQVDYNSIIEYIADAFVQPKDRNWFKVVFNYDGLIDDDAYMLTVATKLDTEEKLKAHIAVLIKNFKERLERLFKGDYDRVSSIFNEPDEDEQPLSLSFRDQLEYYIKNSVLVNRIVSKYSYYSTTSGMLNDITSEIILECIEQENDANRKGNSLPMIKQDFDKCIAKIIGNNRHIIVSRDGLSFTQPNKVVAYGGYGIKDSGKQIVVKENSERNNKKVIRAVLVGWDGDHPILETKDTKNTRDLSMYGIESGSYSTACSRVFLESSPSIISFAERVNSCVEDENKLHRVIKAQRFRAMLNDEVSTSFTDIEGGNARQLLDDLITKWLAYPTYSTDFIDAICLDSDILKTNNTTTEAYYKHQIDEFKAVYNAIMTGKPLLIIVDGMMSAGKTFATHGLVHIIYELNKIAHEQQKYRLIYMVSENSANVSKQFLAQLKECYKKKSIVNWSNNRKIPNKPCDTAVQYVKTGIKTLKASEDQWIDNRTDQYVEERVCSMIKERIVKGFNTNVADASRAERSTVEKQDGPFAEINPISKTIDICVFDEPTTSFSDNIDTQATAFFFANMPRITILKSASIPPYNPNENASIITSNSMNAVYELFRARHGPTAEIINIKDDRISSLSDMYIYGDELSLFEVYKCALTEESETIKKAIHTNIMTNPFISRYFGPRTLKASRLVINEPISSYTELMAYASKNLFVSVDTLAKYKELDFTIEALCTNNKFLEIHRMLEKNHIPNTIIFPKSLIEYRENKAKFSFIEDEEHCLSILKNPNLPPNDWDIYARNKAVYPAIKNARDKSDYDSRLKVFKGNQRKYFGNYRLGIFCSKPSLAFERFKSVYVTQIKDLHITDEKERVATNRKESHRTEDREHDDNRRDNSNRGDKNTSVMFGETRETLNVFNLFGEYTYHSSGNAKNIDTFGVDFATSSYFPTLSKDDYRPQIIFMDHRSFYGINKEFTSIMILDDYIDWPIEDLLQGFARDGRFGMSTKSISIASPKFAERFQEYIRNTKSDKLITSIVESVRMELLK